MIGRLCVCGKKFLFCLNLLIVNPNLLSQTEFLVLIKPEPVCCSTHCLTSAKILLATQKYLVDSNLTLCFVDDLPELCLQYFVEGDRAFYYRHQLCQVYPLIEKICMDHFSVYFVCQTVLIF